MIPHVLTKRPDEQRAVSSRPKLNMGANRQCIDCCPQRCLSGESLRRVELSLASDLPTSCSRYPS